jgi:small subunit ribosomal protein S6
MPKAPTLYDLMLLLSMQGEEDKRTKVIADVEAAITAGGGEIARNQSWGQRPAAFKIDHQAEAEYHLIQFTGPASLLEALSHSLRINDAVLRFRIIKVVPGTPEAPETAPPVVTGSATPAAAAAPTHAEASEAPAAA